MAAFQIKHKVFGNLVANLCSQNGVKEMLLHVHGGKGAKLARLSGWEGWYRPSPLSIKATLANPRCL